MELRWEHTYNYHFHYLIIASWIVVNLPSTIGDWHIPQTTPHMGPLSPSWEHGITPSCCSRCKASSDIINITFRVVRKYMHKYKRKYQQAFGGKHIYIYIYIFLMKRLGLVVLICVPLCMLQVPKARRDVEHKH